MDRNEHTEPTEQAKSVALRKESVDRNQKLAHLCLKPLIVALRKESVDRNQQGPSGQKIKRVALRKESVDRNCSFGLLGFDTVCRSPQGERG